MSRAPSALWRREDFGDLTDSATLDRFLRQLNGFAKQVEGALTRGLALGENALAFWKTVTVAGAPWIAPTLLNSWANYGGSWPPAGFYRNAAGDVRLRGLITGGAAGTNIFTLPVGYRFGMTYSAVLGAFGQSNGSAFSLFRLDASSGTTILYTSGNGSMASGYPASFLSLDGISFRAEDAPPAFTAGASFRNELKMKPRAVLTVSAYDAESGVPYSVSDLPFVTKDDQIQIAAPTFVPPDRKATLTLLVLGG